MNLIIIKLNKMPKLCEYQNCRKRASYAFFYGKPERCKAHKENRKLQYSVCQCGKAQPTFNYKGQKKAICCSKCKKKDMVNVKDKKCQCGKAIPIFNYKGQKKAICCNICKKKDMIDIIHKKCQCGKARPTFSYEGQKTPICCATCKKQNMINITDKKCQCGKVSPHFNYEGQKTPICCATCKKKGMVNIKNRKCQCGKAIPCFNYKGHKRGICCSKCKIEGMIDIKNRKCQCGKAFPVYNYEGQSIAICCNRCRKEDMVDIKSKRCPNCKDWPDFQRSNKKYKNYCARCFQYLFPTDPLTFQIRSKTKEIAVRDFINANFEGFIHDKPLYTGQCDCSHRRRIDHRKQIGNTVLAIETDERQHKGYNKQDEQIRYNDVYMIFSGKWIFIRFNPDKYINKKGKRRNPTIATRLIRLKQEIEKQINRIKNEQNMELIENIKLYYDNFN